VGVEGGVARVGKGWKGLEGQGEVRVAPGGQGERRGLGAEVGAGGGMGAKGTIDPGRSWVEEAEEAQERGERGSRGGRGRRSQ
jgi:hypothetical protein